MVTSATNILSRSLPLRNSDLKTLRMWLSIFISRDAASSHRATEICGDSSYFIATKDAL